MLENHISRSTWFVVATTNNEWLKKMNGLKKRKSWASVVPGLPVFATVVKGENKVYFPFYEHFTLQYYSALGRMYI